MFELFGATPGKDSAVTQAQVRSVIENRDIALAKHPRNRAQGAAESAVEKHRIIATEKLRDSRFQFAMKIGHAREHGRTACSETVGIERVVRRSDDLGMIGQAEVIVGAKIDDALRSAVVSNSGAGVCTGEQFRLIQFDRPRAGLHPGGETWRSLQRVAAFAREEIAQTEFCRVFVHSLWQIGRRGDPSISGQPLYFPSRSRQGLSVPCWAAPYLRLVRKT